MRSYRGILALLLVLGVFAGAFAARLQFGEHTDETLGAYGSIPTIELTREDGTVFSNQTFAGKVYLVNFFFTSCPAICPAVTARLAKLHHAFKDDPRLAMISISVDPANDTPERLREFAARYNVDHARWAFLTGPPETIRALRAEQLKLDDGTSRDYHTVRVLLVDPTGQVRGFYKGTEDEAMKRLNRDLMKLLPPLP